jgi:hypothetical protein
MRFILSLGLVLLFVEVGPTQDAKVLEVLRTIEKARPTDKELEIFRLDWEASFKTAQKRSVDEKRPLLVVAVRNEHGDTLTGHC